LSMMDVCGCDVRRTSLLLSLADVELGWTRTG
jgi:hypothetical protein